MQLTDLPTTDIVTDNARLVALAALLTDAGITHGSATVLAYVLAQPDLPPAVYEDAWTAFDDLEATICPRVIADARDFADGATSADLRAFLLDLHTEYIA
jgi:hypothetical protein